MRDIAIRVEGLGKQYRIGARAERYSTLRERLVEKFIAPLRQVRSWLASNHSERNGGDELIWALRDVSFEIRTGEVVGVIGRNGAGKSTLLKILSRITEPSMGYVEIQGRVGTLLEVGTGFHLELTGRENIYLSGAILGMKKPEIDAKFDEIVAFSEVEQFIDTPVKRYSSGMYLRLAFAVAAHLEPEVLLVDEVLAVGDVAFQKKCLGKIENVAKEGRTVLFVSHNMAAVQSLCSRVILLRQGRIAIDAAGDEAVREYLGRLSSGAEQPFVDNPERSGSGEMRLTSAWVLDEANRPTRSLIAGRPASFAFQYENRIHAARAHVAMTLFNHLGVAVTNFDMSLTDYVMEDLGEEGTFVCHVPNLPLPRGEYRVAIAVQVNGQNADQIPNVLAFKVDSSMFYTTMRTPSVRYCACMVSHKWEHASTKSRGLSQLGETEIR